MTQTVSSQDLSDMIRHVYQSVASLKSCRSNEISNERRLLLRSVEMLLPLFPKRTNAELMARKSQAIDYASEVIIARGA